MFAPPPRCYSPADAPPSERLRLKSVVQAPEIGYATLYFEGKKARLKIYRDHPAYGDVRGYMGRECTYEYDSKRVLRDFYSERDATFGLRRLLAEAGGLKSHQPATRGGLDSVLRTHQDSDDPVAALKEDPFSALRTGGDPDDQPLYGMDVALRLADLFGLSLERKCSGHMGYHILGIEGKGSGCGGHTCYPYDLYIQKFAGVYGRALSLATFSELLAEKRLRVESSMVMSPRAYRFLEDIRSYLAQEPAEAGAEQEAVAAEDGSLTQEQSAAVNSALTRRTTVIVGCAGCGKTRVVERLKRAAGDRVVVCAPTGKAARRAGGVTVHSLVAAHSCHKGGKGSSSPLTGGSLVVVDESSMIDFTMARKLCNIASEVGCGIVFVGDEEQLASVEWGSFLRDVCAWGDSTGNVARLTSVFRQGGSSGILQLATSLRVGGDVSVLFDASFPDLRFVDSSDADAVQFAEEFYHDNPEDSQIVSPSNRVCDEVNRRIVGGRGSILRGDKVLCTKNQQGGEARNGDIGIVKGFLRDGTALVALEGEDAAPLKVARSDLKHGYCITVHKSQGSEWDRVLFLPGGSRPGDFFHKKLLYTAFARARSLLTVAGRRTLLEAVAIAPAPERHSVPLCAGP